MGASIGAMYNDRAVEQAKAAAAPLIAAERARFGPTRDVVLRYASQKHRAPLYLAGDAGIAALRGKPVTSAADTPLEFYTTEPRYHAAAILSTIEAARDMVDLEKLDGPNADELDTDDTPDADGPNADDVPNSDDVLNSDELDADEPNADDAPDADEPGADEPNADEPGADEPNAGTADEPNAGTADDIAGTADDIAIAPRPILAAAFWDPVHFVEEDTRRVVVLWPLPRPPGGTNSVRPPAIPAATCGGGDVLCFPPELRLYEVYRGLCDLTRAEEWPRLLAEEAALFAALSDLRERVVAVTGGRDRPRVSESGGLERRFARGSGRAVIPARGDGPMQLVSANDIETDLASIKRGAERTGAKIQTRVVEIGFPTDARLRRLKVYRKGPRGLAPILDVFNAAEYAPVPLAVTAPVDGGRAQKRRPASRSPKPTGDDRVRAVSLFAELRFRVADLWTALLLFERSVIDKTRARQLVADAHAAMTATRAEIAKSAPGAVLPVTADAYLGAYVPDLVLNRRGKRRYDGKMPIVRA